MAVTFQSIAVAALSKTVETIEFRSLAGPPVKFRVLDLVESSGPPSPYVRFLKPTIILKGQVVGTQIIAPGGQAGPNAWKLPTGVALSVLGIGALTLLGAAYRIGKRSR